MVATADRPATDVVEVVIEVVPEPVERRSDASVSADLVPVVPVGQAVLVVHRPSLDRLVSGAHDGWERTRHGWYRRRSRRRLRLHLRRSAPDPRRQSLVRHYVPVQPEDLVGWFAAEPSVDAVGAVAELHCSGEGRWGATVGRVDGQLTVRRVRRPMPVSLVIEPWWRGRSTISLELRPERGRRYSRRYFDAAHQVLSDLSTRIRSTAS